MPAGRVLMTGAAGFLGGHASSELRRRGYDVVTTDRRGAVDAVGDLAEPSFTAGLPDVDVVVHAAGVQYVSPDLPFFNRRRWFHRNNFLATRNLVDRFSRQRVHFVYVSTSMTYAQDGRECGASVPREAQGLYSESKLAAESYVAAHVPGSATVVPCIIAGEGRGGLFVPFVRSMKHRGIAVVPGRGRNKVSLVHVTDVSALIATIVDARASGVFNAAATDAVSLLDWVDEIEGALGLPRVRRLTVPYGLVHTLAQGSVYRVLAREQLLMLNHDHVLSLEASRALGWEPRWSNRDIVRETARALAKSG